MGEMSGADRQIRTADLTLTKGALYQLSHISVTQKMERTARIELAALAWKAKVLPLYDVRTLAHIPYQAKVVEGAGFEPAKAEPSDLQSDPVDRLGTPPD